MEDNSYKYFIETAPFGFAYRKIIVNDKGIPSDYTFICVNNAYEKLTGLKREQIINRRISEIILGIYEEKFNWIKFYGEIALNGGEGEFTEYSKALKKWYKVKVYSTEKYYFSSIIQDVTEEQEKIVRIEKREQYIKKLLYAIPDLLFVLNREGIILDYKAGNEEDLAMPEELFLNKSIFGILPEYLALQIKSGIERAVKKQRIKRIEYQIPVKTGIGYFECRIVSFEEDKVIAVINNISERKKMEEELKSSEQNFRNFFETMNDLIIIGNKQGKILFTNSAVTKKLGYTQKELKNMNIPDVYPLKVKKNAAKKIANIFEKNTDKNCSLPLMGKNGGYLPVEARIWFGKWDGEECIFEIAKDVSKEQESLLKFNKIFNNNPSLMAITSAGDRKFVEVNRMFLDKFGYAKDEIIGKTALDLQLYVQPEKQDLMYNEIKNNKKIQNFEAKLKAKNGKTLDGVFSGEIIEIQEKNYFIIIVNDVTEQKKAEEAIKKQNGLITSLLDSIPDLIFFKDTEGVYLGCNDSFSEFVGRSREEIVGRTDYDLFGKEIADLFRYNDKKMFESLESRHNEEWVTYPSGKVVLLDTLKTPYLGQDKELIGVLGISRDITKRKKDEEALRKIADRLSLATRAGGIGI